MLDPEFVKWFATLGIGGILAAFMFVFYRKDVQMYTSLWKETSDRLMKVITENTQSNIKLITMIENWERNSMRKQDIERMIDARILEAKLQDK